MFEAVAFSQVISPFTLIHPAILVHHDAGAVADSGQIPMHSQYLAKKDYDVVLQVLQLFKVRQRSQFVETQHLQVHRLNRINLKSLDVDRLTGHRAQDLSLGLETKGGLLLQA